ncbi:3'-5' exonuclease [Mitsuokella sp. oral taxon 131]|uniref:3'-5' exonuclease n=1 Tax=Mitsuokella sp. oral taxon 131 TaxID=1321780 RepID=UPI0003F4FA85|nr:3'-5' exonuclease [Mitsuokella sp. oral taxon 131]
MDFVAIDFETATGARDSACSVALVEVRAGRIADSYYTLIRPPENCYNAFNIGIHGITEEETEDAPDFSGVWAELERRLEGKLVIAHNAYFDMGVLRACLVRYALDWPSFAYCDTVAIARRVWPELPNHKLHTVADHLHLKFRHHDALEDAKACAAIPLRASEDEEGETFRAFARRVGVRIVSFA